MTASFLISQFQLLANDKKAAIFQRFFKTEKGEYGEGDIFLGLTVPQVRKLAVTGKALPLPEIVKMLHCPLHEVRLGALIILTLQYPHAALHEQKAMVDLYLSHTTLINNWDLVDCSANKIVGAYLKTRPRTILNSLARSTLVWDRRIAIIATIDYARAGEAETVLEVAEILVHDSHDLIHKAVGWVLRELGKKNPAAERAFLKKHYLTMPRTMLRYAIEKFPENERQQYLKGKSHVS